MKGQTRTIFLLVTVLVLGLELGDLRVDLFHIETLHSVQHLLQGLPRKGTGLIEDQDASRKAIKVGMPSMPS